MLDKDPLGWGVTRGDDMFFMLLGEPGGSWEYKDEVLEGRLASGQQLLERLHTLMDPHMVDTLLRSCFSYRGRGTHTVQLLEGIFSEIEGK